MPRQVKKIYKSPKEFECRWESAAPFLMKGYKVSELTKRGGTVYVRLIQE